jgi:hypothetical protein
MIGAAAILLTVGLLAPQPASAASGTTTSANLVTTVTPAFQEQTEYFNGHLPHFTFTAEVTNNGPDSASSVVVSVSGYTTTLGFSASPTAVGCTSPPGNPFSCLTLPVGASVTVAIGITRYCPGHVCSGGFTVTAASADPNTTDSAGGGWEILCWRIYGNCGI